MNEREPDYGEEASREDDRTAKLGSILGGIIVPWSPYGSRMHSCASSTRSLNLLPH